jgi:hypothetical protein
LMGGKAPVTILTGKKNQYCNHWEIINI